MGFSVLAIVPLGLPLKLEAGFARCIRQRLDAAVIHETGPVEGDLADTLGLGPFRDRAAFCSVEAVTSTLSPACAPRLPSCGSKIWA
jgi:hypothetical protein